MSFFVCSWERVRSMIHCIFWYVIIRCNSCFSFYTLFFVCRDAQNVLVVDNNFWMLMLKHIWKTLRYNKWIRRLDIFLAIRANLGLNRCTCQTWNAPITLSLIQTTPMPSTSCAVDKQTVRKSLEVQKTCWQGNVNNPRMFLSTRCKR